MPRLYLCLGLSLAVMSCAKKESVEQVTGGLLAISVTENGFEPAEIRVRKGVDLKLVVTRKTDKTCARDFVLDEAGINQPLPLDAPVTISLNLKEPGALVFGCAMGKMVKGTISAE